MSNKYYQENQPTFGKKNANTMKKTFKKLFENQTKFLTDPVAIKAWLDKYEVENYKINPDGTVECEIFAIFEKGLKEIPVKLSKARSIDITGNEIKRIDFAPPIVEGDFDCWGNMIETLEGGPEKIMGSFDCDSNQLTDLSGGPKFVGGSYVCSGNPITSLKGVADHVGKYFKAVNCKLKELDFFPTFIGTNIYIKSNEITSFKGIQKKLKSFGTVAGENGKSGIIILTGNPIKEGLISVLGIRGLKELVYTEPKNTDAKRVFEAIKILNKIIVEGKDIFDAQDAFIEAGLKDLS